MSGPENIDIAWLNTVLAQAHAHQFYGEITIILEAGVIKRATKKESLKPPSSNDSTCGKGQARRTVLGSKT